MSSHTSLFLWPLDVIARPERLVTVQDGDREQHLVSTVIEMIRLLAVYSINLVLYAAPLTLAGFGVVEGIRAPPAVVNLLDPIVADPNRVWAFSLGLVENSAFLLVATLLTFVTFHVGVLLTGASRGVLKSLRAVTYSTGIYLAVMFTLVWTAATVDSIDAAEEFLVWLQAEFIYYFIDLLGSDLNLPGGRPEPVALEGLSSEGEILLLLLLLSAVYYLYVLYVGARVGHDASRFSAAIATGFVAVAPALYVIGLLLFTMWTYP